MGNEKPGGSNHDGIREPEIERDAKGRITAIRFGFGPHHFVEVVDLPDLGVMFVFGATHHGIKAEASEVGGELEHLIDELRRRYPDNAF